MIPACLLIVGGLVGWVIGRAGGPSRNAYNAGYEDGFMDASDITEDRPS